MRKKKINKSLVEVGMKGELKSKQLDLTKF